MKIKSNWIQLFYLFFAVSMLLTACGQDETASPAEETNQEAGAQAKKLSIYTSMYPIYDFASKIAGERAEVINIVPPGTEPHDFEPTAKDLVNLSESDLFIYNGGGFEGWIDKVLEALDSSNMTVINMSEHIELLTNEQTGHDHDEEEQEGHGHEEEHKEEHGHEEEQHKDDHGHEEARKEEHHHDHEEGIYDPHFWLDPLRAKAMATVIKEALIEVDSEGREAYEANYQKLAEEFDKLDAEFSEMVKQAKRKEFIVSHAAFGYLSARYGLKQVAIAGLSPSDEPSPKQLEEIIAFAKEHDVKYILFETLVNAKVAQVVKQEVGAEALTLNPIEGLTQEEIAEGKDYFTVMRDNLENLRKALESHL